MQGCITQNLCHGKGGLSNVKLTTHHMIQMNNILKLVVRKAITSTKCSQQNHTLYFQCFFSFAYQLNKVTFCQFQGPVEGRAEKHLCCLCCALGRELNITAKLDQKGWACGQEIVLHGEVVNSTSKVIPKAIVQIEQVTITYDFIIS